MHDAKTLDALRDALSDELRPSRALQQALFDLILSKFWRLMRVSRIETDILQAFRAGQRKIQVFLKVHGGILMKGKTHNTEEIIRILRQADGGRNGPICLPGAQYLRANLLSVQEEIRRYGFSRCQRAQSMRKRKCRAEKDVG